jgi:predicted transport protein
MSEIKLFNISSSNKSNQIKPKSLRLEKQIQDIVEKNLEELFGIRFLASEYMIDSGRVDTLGLDENDCPVIIEYKLDSNSNVINQGLFYLDWFMEHKADFDLLCREKLGTKVDIDWDNPRLLCIATDFNKYDDNAIKQINRNIELIRYTLFENDFLMVQLASAVTEKPKSSHTSGDKYTKDRIEYKLKTANKDIVSYTEELDEYILDLGDDIQKKELKNYWAYKTIKNLVCIVINKDKLGVYLSVDYKDIDEPRSHVEDVKDKGHWGTGNTVVFVSNDEELEYSKELIKKVYTGI